ncbi:MAG TPA: CRTAC1 family protein [Vicinamibacteria bacterium]|nr:CRTAC1 family protein [Vicinamibacteria bacterium]
MTLLLSLILASSAHFVEVTAAVRLEFTHDAGEKGGYFIGEIMGSGAAFLDFDGDADLDIYFVQSAVGKPNQLFRQEKDGRFVDVTFEAGVGDRGYGMGVAVGDIDNDGDVDLYVTKDGPDVLYLNDGEGTFRNVTSAWGAGTDSWSASAAFCDYDADGFLDLYVTRYVAYDREKKCTQLDGSVDYCAPQVFPGITDVLYHNEGGRRFADVSVRAGLSQVRAPGLGVLCADLNDDGRLDFYVTNDGEANQLWLNRGDGTFVDEAFLEGVALDGAGKPEAGMGITAGDIEGDGDLDLFMTHIINQTNTLYVREIGLGYEDRTTAMGLAALSLSRTGFGVGFFDFDHDSDLDIAVVNGRIKRHPILAGASHSEYWNPYAEPNQLIENDGSGRFSDRSADAGDFGKPIEVSRGLAFGDVDSDGDLDLLVVNISAPARLYRNEVRKTGDWLAVRAIESGRDSHGVRVTVNAGGRRIVRLANPGYSYLSSSDPRAHFGVPKGAKIESVEIVWPDGSRETFDRVEANRSVTLSKGSGARR